MGVPYDLAKFTHEINHRTITIPMLSLKKYFKIPFVLLPDNLHTQYLFYFLFSAFLVSSELRVILSKLLFGRTGESHVFDPVILSS